jgi:SAM-dependent methyltransferase
MINIRALLTGRKKYDDNYIQMEFDKRGPWVTQFIINDKTYGGYYRVWEDIRPHQFFEKFPHVKTILDVGSLEGGQTFILARHKGVTVTGIEGRSENIRRAEFVRKILGIKNVRFIHYNIEVMPLDKLGKFDAVFCSGVLYHLPEPWKFIKQVQNITSNLFLWTHFVADEKADQIVEGYHGWWYPEGGISDPLAGLSSKSFWLTLDSLKSLLMEYDFKHIDLIKIDMNHENGPCVTLAATKSYI